MQWQPPMNDGGSKISQYIIERRHIPDGRWLRCNYENVTVCEYIVSGLTPTDTYEFRIIAKNTMGTIGIPSEPTEPVKCEERMESPQIQLDAALLTECFALRAGHNVCLETQIIGRPMPKVSWYRNGSQIETGDRAIVQRDMSSSSLLIKDCTKFDTAKYEIVAVNECGEARDFINVKVIDRPDRPAGPIAITQVMGNQFTIGWQIPLLDGGSPVNHYTVEKSHACRWL